jgi:hypothetical protein
LGKHRLVCGDCTQADIVAKLLGTEKPLLMVTDPPYGVEYDPEWRARAGVNQNRAKLGKVQNDDRADWREALSLFPGDRNGAHDDQVDAMTQALLRWNMVQEQTVVYYAPRYQISPI